MLRNGVSGNECGGKILGRVYEGHDFHVLIREPVAPHEELANIRISDFGYYSPSQLRVE